VTKPDIEEHFSTHGSGKITEIKLMNGFGFIEYEDAMDARDVVPGKSSWSTAVYQSANHPCSLPYVLDSGWTNHNDPLTKLPPDGSDFKGERLTVQFARGPRRKENFPGPAERPTAPRPRRTMFRMQISGLPETSWQVSSSNPSPFPPGFPDLIFPWLLCPNTSCLPVCAPLLGRGS
jgi:hypothetical protein